MEGERGTGPLESRSRPPRRDEVPAGGGNLRRARARLRARSQPGRGKRMGRILRVAVLTAAALGLFAGPALACGALVSPNGTVQLGRTVTLAAYHNGIEHYVTEFTFNGSGSKFGSIVPLPARPTRVVQA